ncbi:MAG TPA: ornithine cyclodeaminase family protein [Beijerinckiaceae bacterium]|nr:ornithine cyclodeaminase family protein [Beijerinckiaceae bacterium]
MTLIVSNEEVERLLTMSDCIGALEQAYRELAEGRAVSRTRSDTMAPIAGSDALYSLKSMDGVAPQLGVGAVRINSDVIRWPRVGNSMRREKTPAAPGGRWVGLVLLFSSETGEPLAIMPDGVMQRVRVGACNGLGVKYLARPEARRIGLLGSGWQAGAQLSAACAVRSIEEIACFSPNRDNRERFAREMSETLGIDVRPVESPEEALDGADIAMCASNSVDNIFFAHWLRPGLHVSSIKRPEIEPEALRLADRVVVHTHDAKPIHTTTKDLVIPENDEAGKGWRNASEIDFRALPTLPQVIAGHAPGRQSEREVTCFLNNLGLGFQFAVAGALVYRRAKELGIGHELPTDWFTEDVHP